jgi:hypothetical protein
MDDQSQLGPAEAEILALLDAAEVGHARRLFSQAHQVMDLGDRLIAQRAVLAALAEPAPDPTTNPTGGTAPQAAKP